jgi:hypothetical protein
MRSDGQAFGRFSKVSTNEEPIGLWLTVVKRAISSCAPLQAPIALRKDALSAIFDC